MLSKQTHFMAMLFTLACLCLSACQDKQVAQDVDAQEDQPTANASNLSDNAAPPELAATPVSQTPALEEGEMKSTVLLGSIIYKDIEGGFFAFISDKGDHYTLYGLDEAFQKDGLLVKVTGTPKPDLMTTTQFGTVFAIESVEVLDATNAKTIPTSPPSW